jgi:hypothetical protein
LREQLRQGLTVEHTEAVHECVGVAAFECHSRCSLDDEPRPLPLDHRHVLDQAADAQVAHSGPHGRLLVGQPASCAAQKSPVPVE